MLTRFPTVAVNIIPRLRSLKVSSICVSISNRSLSNIETHRHPILQKKDNLLCAKAYYGTTNKVEVVDYDIIKQLGSHPEKLLIDVREPSELKETGQIPHSINIPLNSVVKELSSEVTADDFIKKYGRKRPDKSSEIIFHCKAGVRSAQAAQQAMKLGYKNVKNYEGSWLDWAKREGLPN